MGGDPADRTVIDLGEPPRALEPVEVDPDRVRRGRWWFVVVPVAVIVLLVAVALQLRPGGEPDGPPLPQLSPRVALPEITGPPVASGPANSGAAPSAGPSQSPTTSPSPRRPTATSGQAGGPPPGAAGVQTSPAPSAHPGAVLGSGGLCLSASGMSVQLARCENVDRQRWSVRDDDDTVRALGDCLDVAGGAEANGSVVILFDCNDSDAQEWEVRGDGTWRNPRSGRCLTPAGTDPGTRLVIQDCSGAANQRWTLT